MRILSISLLTVLSGFLLAGCSGTFSGSDKAYLSHDKSVAKTKSQPGAVLKQETQYFPKGAVNAQPNYQPPSKLPPGQTFTQPVKKKHEQKQP